MSTLKIDRIHHVAYRCKDAKETVEWYVKHLNMNFVLAIAEDQVPSTKAPDPYMHVFLDAGQGNVLAFFELPNAPAMGRDANTPEWVQHIAFKIGSLDMLEATKERLQAAGIEVLGPTDHTIFKSIYFFDPNGHRLELCADVGTPRMHKDLDEVKWDMLNEWAQTKRATLDDTHNPGLRSWVDSANEPESDFPIQNLPFGRFKVEDDPEWRIGVAIGDQVLDLRVAGLINFSDMNRLIRLKPEARRELRAQISTGLAAGSPQQDRWSQHLHPQGAVELGLPCDIRDYTDFYVGIHHATAVGKLFRPDNPLLPNYKWVPIGYHGRASTIQPSGHSFHRPLGQIKGPDTDAPMLAPTRRLDLELELGYVIGRPNAMGHPIPLAEAEDHVFGVTLFNDWSARDFQAWEYQPLGPFLSKNFASTLSPWMVTLEALAPFRQVLQRPAGDPAPLPYLQAEASQRAGAFDIDLDVLLQTARMRTEGLAPEIISRSNAAPPHGQRLRAFGGRSVWLGHALGAAARAGRLAARTHRGGQAGHHPGQRRAAHLPRRRRQHHAARPLHTRRVSKHRFWRMHGHRAATARRHLIFGRHFNRAVARWCT